MFKNLNSYFEIILIMGIRHCCKMKTTDKENNFAVSLAEMEKQNIK